MWELCSCYINGYNLPTLPNLSWVNYKFHMAIPNSYNNTATSTKIEAKYLFSDTISSRNLKYRNIKRYKPQLITLQDLCQH